MPSVYTARFVLFTTNAAGYYTIFTANDLWVWIIRDVVVSSFSVDPDELIVYVGPGPGNVPLLGVPTTTYAQTYHWEGRQELLPSEEISLQVKTGPARVVVTGYKLTPPIA